MNFIYKKLASSHFGTTMWLQVSEFRNKIEEMIDKNITINNTTVWPIMSEILNRNPKQELIDGVQREILYKALKEVRRGSYEEMDNKDFVGDYGRLYQKIMSLRRDEDYVVNPIQMDRFLDLVGFFMMKSKDATDSKVDPYGFTPRECHGGVTATFIVFDICGDEVPEFCRVLKHCSAVSIDCAGDAMVEISCTVPDVFVRKTN